VEQNKNCSGERLGHNEKGATPGCPKFMIIRMILPPEIGARREVILI